MNAPVCGHSPSLSQSLAGWLFGLLIALLLLTLALPLLNPAGWLGRAQQLILGPADQPIATLSRHSLLYKSDSRGLYLVVRSQWQLLKPLQEGDKVRVELLNDKGVRIDQLSQAVDKRQKCRKERCTLSLNSALVLRATDKRLVNFERIHRQRAQVGQRRIARAKIIHRQRMPRRVPASHRPSRFAAARVTALAHRQAPTGFTLQSAGLIFSERLACPPPQFPTA